MCVCVWILNAYSPTHAPTLFCVTIGAAICVIIGMFTFGGGMGDDTVKLVCGADADQFERGDCDLGYSSGLAVATFVLCLISAIMSIYVKPVEEQIA